MRSLLERRRQMRAWNTAVAVNTAASFETFLASYGNSDLAATARRMQQRVLNRSLGANAALTTPVVPVALAPTCPCSTPALPLKKVETAPTKKVDATPTRRVDKSSPKKRRPPPDEEVVVERGPPGPPPGPVMEGGGVGIGFGMGGMGGGYGGGGFGGRGGGGYRR
jgi:hypothetical protein